MAGSGIMKSARGLRADLPRHGELGEIADLRSDVAKAFEPLANITVEEFTNPPAAAAAGVRVATAVTVAPQVVAASGLVGGAAVTLLYPRPISVTTAGGTPADAPATVTVTGTDVDGKAQTEDIAVPQTAATAIGTKAFKTVTGLSFTAAQGTDATVAVGWAAPLGLQESPKVRAGIALPVLEVAVGARVTTGALSDAATNPPHGLYTPAAAANGTNDYAVLFEAIPD